jgi:hypothetical protein
MQPEKKKMSRIILITLAHMKSKSHSMLMTDASPGVVCLPMKNYLLLVDGVEYAKYGVYQIAKSELS